MSYGVKTIETKNLLLDWTLFKGYWDFLRRRVKVLFIEGCSLLTTEGLECAVLSWKDLQKLRVVSCKSIKDSEVSPALSTLFSILKELQWRPDTTSLLSSSLVESGMGKRGSKFFKKTWEVKWLPDSYNLRLLSSYLVTPTMARNVVNNIL